MLGSKLKSWMEMQVAKVRVSKTPWRREDGSSSGVPSSCSNDTSILLGGGSSMGSFTHNLSSPDTGYSTDGYSPKSQHPPLPFSQSQVNNGQVMSKTSLLTQGQQSRVCGQRSETGIPQNQILSSFISSSRTPQESPRKPPRLSKIKQQLEQQQLLQERTVIDGKIESECSKVIRTSLVSSSGDSGQGTLGSNRISGESFGQFRFPNICEEPRETEILSDWAPTDEDVDDGVLTPTPTPPPCPTSPCPGLPDTQVIQTSDLPKAYDTLQLLNQCNHVFPLPTCTGPRCLQAQMESRPTSSRKRGGKSTGPFGFLKKLFKRKSSVERDLPENSRGKPIRTGPTGYWLTPTPNSFRKRTMDTNYCSTTIPKGVKSDIIRLPQTTPTTLPNSTSTPTHIAATAAARDSPFLSRLNSTTTSPASIRFKPQQIVTPIHQSPRPIIAFSTTEELPPRLPPPNIPTNSRIQPPSFNNYSPIHRLVVTTGVHHFHHHRPAPESPLVRHLQHSRPPPPPPPRQAITPTLAPKSHDLASNSRYQYIPSSNQNSPNLNNVVPRRVSLPTVTFEAKHYYASPLTQNSCHAQRLPMVPLPPVQYQGTQTFDIDRIYEKVEGTEVSDEGDGEGGVYECDDVSWGDSEFSVSQGQESSRSRQSQLSAQTSQSAQPRSVHIEQQNSRFPPTAWKFSKTELKLLEKEADLKYKKLIWEAEILLRQFTMDDSRKSNVQNNARQRAGQVHQQRRETFTECSPASDPLRRKTYDCWALRRLQQELALSCASPPVLHRSRHNLHSNPHNPKLNHHQHHHHPVI